MTTLIGNPLVSVIIRTYNRKKYVVEAINSVLAQSYKNHEIVLVDVGSTDDTRKLVETRYRDKIRYFYFPSRNHFKAFNFAVQQAKADLLLMLDDDDLLLPTNMEKQVDVLIKNPGVSIVFSRYRVFKDQDQDQTLDESQWVNTNNLFEEMMKYNAVPFSGTLIWKECIAKVGGVDENLISCMDYDLWLRLVYSGYKFYCIDEVLTLKRDHDSNMLRKMPHILRGSIATLEKLSRYLDSEKLKKSIVLSKSIAGFYLRLGIVLLDEGHYREGRTQILRAISLNAPGKKWALLYLFLSFLISKRRIDSLMSVVFKRRLLELGPIIWQKARFQ